METHSTSHQASSFIFDPMEGRKVVREQTWLCECGTELLLRSPLRGSFVTHKVECPDCKQSFDIHAPSPLVVYRHEPQSAMQVITVYEKQD